MSPGLGTAASSPRPGRWRDGRHRALGSLALVAGCLLLGAMQGLRPALGAFLLVLAALLAVQGVGSRLLLPVLVVSTFVTRFRLDLAGLNFLPEHFFVIALFLALLTEGRGGELWRVVTDRTSLALAAFVGWLALVSVLQAPVPAQSLSIVGWLCLDWLLLVSVLATVRSSVSLERLATSSSTALAALAVLVWLAFIFAGSTIGTQETLIAGAGSRAVYATSLEANILASTLALWAFVGLSSPDRRVGRTMRIGLPLSILSIVFSATRAAMIGLVAGVLAWMALDRRGGRSRSLRLLSLTALAATLLVATVPQLTAPVQGKLGELLSFDSGNGALRVRAAEAALEDLKSPQLLVGYGANSFGQHHTDPARPGQPWYLSVLPLQILYDGGLIGVAIILIALFTVRPLRRPARALGALAVYCSAATATSPFWLGTTWLLIALAVLTRPDDARPPPARG